MRTLFVLALVVAVLADPVPLNNCGGPNDPLVINSANATPWPPVIGQALQVDVTATLSSAITAGTVEAKVVFDGIPLIDEKKDLCNLDPNITCPIAAQNFKVSQSVTLPSFLPGGEYNITISAVDGSGSTIACYNLDVTLSSSKKHTKGGLQLDAPAQTREIVDFVNALGTTWTAGHNKRFTYNTLRHVKNLCGAKKGGPKLPVKRVPKKMALPTAFDPRDGSKWPACKDTLNHVRDQGACGSCWAFGAAEAMTDRICIASNGQQNYYLSAEDLTSCCDSCGMGCEGGYPSAAWDYFQSTGIVTGGDWNSKQGCYPYQLQACDHHVTGKYQPCGDIQPTPSCSNKCQNNATWTTDKHFGASSYSVGSDQQSIMTEIYTNGPVEAAFDVYADFVTYKSGVYQHVTGDYLGGHAIKIIGWGVDGSTPYWIVANSWNNDWGNNGFFNILRGSDECGIEDGVVAGVPKVSKH